MKKAGLVLFVISMLMLQPLALGALTSSDAKQLWYDAKLVSRDVQAELRAVKIMWAANKTDENNQKVIQTGKSVLYAALDEVEAWLIWRSLDVEENPEIPTDLKVSIQEDVQANLGKLDSLRIDVDGVGTQFELAIVSLKMVGKYLELLVDVARSTGFVWVHMANTYTDRVEEYEDRLREAAVSMSGNEAIIETLDLVRSEIETARLNIDDAEDLYEQVVLPGTPLAKFSNGNNYLRMAKNNLLSAHSYLNQVYREMVSEE